MPTAAARRRAVQGNRQTPWARMRRASARDIFVIALFGVVSPWIWIALLGVFAVLEVPVLSAISRNLGSLSRTFVFSYLVGFDVFAALLCAAVIALPLGYFLRSRPVWGWLQFALLFWGILIVAALLSDEPFDVSYLYAHRDVWLFLAASAVFVVVGHRLMRRRAED
jgi:hypothetical protein